MLLLTKFVSSWLVVGFVAAVDLVLVALVFVDAAEDDEDLTRRQRVSEGHPERHPGAEDLERRGAQNSPGVRGVGVPVRRDHGHRQRDDLLALDCGPRHPHPELQGRVFLNRLMRGRHRLGAKRRWSVR